MDKEKIVAHCNDCNIDWIPNESLYCPQCGKLCNSTTQYKQFKMGEFTAICGIERKV